MELCVYGHVCVQFGTSVSSVVGLTPVRLRQVNYHNKLKNASVSSLCKQQSCSGDHQSGVGFTGYVLQIIYHVVLQIRKMYNFSVNSFQNC
jgi:hypothetical protein